MIPRDDGPRPRTTEPTGKRIEALDSELGLAIEQLLDALARQIKRLDRGNVPCRLDSGTAGKVRIVLADLVGELESRGQLPTELDPDVLIGRAFRAAVDLGPLSAWLDDSEVGEIRISRPDAAQLLRGGQWVDAPTGFVSREELAETIRCLGAGKESRDEGGMPGLARFRLEEGPLVLTALSPVSSSGPAAVIHKYVSPRLDSAGVSVKSMVEAARRVVEEAIGARARIAVVGASGPVRLSVFTDLLRMLPLDDYLVGVEDTPLVGYSGPRRVGLAAHGSRPDGERIPVVGGLLARAADMEPDWIAVSGTRWIDLPDVIACASARKGMVADLPLGGRGSLDRTLAAALAVAGAHVNPDMAASLLKTAFDVVVVAARTRSGVPAVRQIAATGLGANGEWAAKVVYDPSAKG
jgi:Flp pilus assembly CpaF family ATPase